MKHLFLIASGLLILVITVASHSAAAPQCPNGLFVIPSEGTLGWPYLYPGGGQAGFSDLHTGIDILGTTADDVYAAYDGEVIQTTASSVTIWHSTLNPQVWTYYSHMSVVSVGLGTIKRGNPIGKKGSVGTNIVHLHFSVKIKLEDERYLENTTDPSPYLAANVNYQNGAKPFERSVSGWCTGTPSGNAVDVFLLVDLSRSFADDLPVFRGQAPVIISVLKALKPNIRFGLGKYEDYPIPPFGNSGSGDKAYERLVDLTFDTGLVLATIAGLVTRSGGDDPESQLAALFQAATGAGQNLAGVGFPMASIPSGQQANFRDGAAKLFLLWTDAPFHRPGDPGTIPYPGPSFSETVNAILALDPPKVIGISSGGGGTADLKAIAAATGALAPAGGIDCNNDGIIDVRAGEPLVCSIGASGEGIAEATIALTEAAAEPDVNKPVFVYPAHGQILDYRGSYLFRVNPIANAQGFLWGFFQNGIMVWENWRDEGTLSSNEYGIHPGTTAHSRFAPGSVQVWVRALIAGQWTDATIITIYLQ